MAERTPGYGTVLGIAGAAAGAVGTIAAILMDRDSESQSPQHVEKRRRDEVKSTPARKETKRFRIRSQDPPPTEAELARQRARDLGVQAASLAASGIGVARSRIESGDLQVASRHLASALKDRSRESASRAGSLGIDVSARATDLVTEARNQVPGLVEAVGRAALDARDRGAQLGSQARERLPEVRGQVESRVTPIVKDLQKQAKPLLGEVTAAAGSVRGSAEAKAHGARSWAEKDALPEVRAAVTNVSAKAAEKAKSAELKVANVSAGATGKLSAVEDRSRQAASSAAQGTRDTGAIAFWASVAGGLVFYAFMNEEQRAQVKEAALRIGSEAREIYRDIQGHDEEFV